MAFLTIPVVIVSVEEALRAVPDEYPCRQPGVGRTKWQTIRKVLIPNSISEYSPVPSSPSVVAPAKWPQSCLPAVAYFLPHLPTSLSDQFMNLGYHVCILSTQSPDVEASRGLQFATVLVLLAVTFLMSLSAIIIRYQFRKKIKTG